jgi:hypothetical protein
MSKSSTPKAAAKKPRKRKFTSKVGANKPRTTNRKTSQLAAEKTPHRKEAPKAAAEMMRDTHRKVATIEEIRSPQKPDAMPAVAETSIVHLDEFRPMLASAKARVDHQIEELRTQVPASMQALAERNVEKARALYQRSANAFDAAFESWESALDAAGQGVVALNRKIMDIAERNISTGFDLAARLASAKNPVEAVQLQAAFWRKQSDELRMQLEEVRALLEKVTDRVTAPMKAGDRTP